MSIIPLTPGTRVFIWDLDVIGKINTVIRGDPGKDDVYVVELEAKIGHKWVQTFRENITQIN